MTKFKVGDKVRILNANGIKPNSRGVKNGEIATVTGATDSGVVIQRDSDGVTMGVFTQEFAYIEKVADKPTKKQRISALESEVNVLKAELEALKQAQVRTDVAKIADRLAELIADEPAPTPNELRKAIIADARAFVEDVTYRMAQYGHRNILGEHGEITTNVRGFVTKVEFVVNAEKRTVVAIVRNLYGDYIREKAIAKCAPGDVFNADIGKAIALGRALGLDVSKFEQAVQPTEVVVGMNVIYRGYRVEVMPIRTGCMYSKGTVALGSYAANNSVIIDDTEAQYE